MKISRSGIWAVGGFVFLSFLVNGVLSIDRGDGHWLVPNISLAVTVLTVLSIVFSGFSATSCSVIATNRFKGVHWLRVTKLYQQTVKTIHDGITSSLVGAGLGVSVLSVDMYSLPASHISEARVVLFSAWIAVEVVAFILAFRAARIITLIISSGLNEEPLEHHDIYFSSSLTSKEEESPDRPWL